MPLVPSFVVKDGLLYLWSDSGIVTCLEAENGKVLWRERVGGEFYSSPIWIDRRLYCISKQGEVVVLAAGRKFEVMSRMELGEKTFATPAVANGSCISAPNRVYIRWGKLHSPAIDSKATP